jgi:hypothetical protein
LLASQSNRHVDSEEATPDDSEMVAGQSGPNILIKSGSPERENAKAKNLESAEEIRPERF